VIRGRLRRRGDDRGFTLIELGVASALLILAVISMGYVLDSGLNVTKRVDDATTAQRNGRLALDTLVREARVRQVVLNASAGTGVPDPGPLAFAFTTVSDPAAGVAAHRIVYSVSGGKLWKKTDSGAAVDILDGVLNDDDPRTADKPALFTYYDASTPPRDLYAAGLQSSIPASSRRVLVSLVVSTNRGAPLLLESDLTFRSLS